MDRSEKVVLVIRSFVARREAGDGRLYSGSERLREDLGFDSIDLAELTARLDYEFGVDIFADGPVQTVGEVLAKVERSARRG